MSDVTASYGIPLDFIVFFDYFFTQLKTIHVCCVVSPQNFHRLFVYTHILICCHGRCDYRLLNSFFFEILMFEYKKGLTPSPSYLEQFLKMYLFYEVYKSLEKIISLFFNGIQFVFDTFYQLPVFYPRETSQRHSQGLEINYILYLSNFST